MNDIKILLYTQQTPAVEYDVSYIDEIPISLNYLIADIRTPDKINSSFSKTINLPGTKEVNRFFELIWKSNISLNYFNPNYKCNFLYYINGVLQLQGDLQLIKINVNDVSGEVVYECSCKGTIGNLFSALNDLYLTDLDFSEYNHTLTPTNVSNSWATSIIKNSTSQAFALGEGYVYPLINYGKTTVNMETDYPINYFRPALYKKTIIDKIFEKASLSLASGSYSYTSSYLTSNYYLSHIVPCTNDKFTKSAQQLIDNQMYVNVNSQFSLAALGTIFNSINNTYSAYYLQPIGSGSQQTIIFNQTTPTPYNDAAGKYSSGTGLFTQTTPFFGTTIYNTTTVINFDLVFRLATPSGTADYVQILTGDVTVRIKDTIGYSVINTFSLVNEQASFTTTTLAPLTNRQISVSTPSFYAIGSIPINVQIEYTNLTYEVRDVLNIPLAAGSSDFYTDIKTGTNWIMNYANQEIVQGDTVNLNSLLPNNIKINDWLNAEIKLGNLFIDVDKTNPLNYIIEDRPSFYTSQYVDWSDKRDYSQPRQVLPMGLQDTKQITFKYKADNDYFNDKYQRDYLQPLGTKITEIESDFIKNKLDVEVLYSPTPLVGNNSNGLIIPYIYKVDSNVISPTQANIRSLYYAGLKTLSYGTWNFTSSNSTSTSYSTFPFAGDCDDPYNPTLTINWATPYEIYYDYIPATYPSSNLYSRYYETYYNLINDVNSKLEVRFYNLTPYDIKNLDFRKLVFDDGYYIINKVLDYDFTKQQSTKVELLKLIDSNA